MMKGSITGTLLRSQIFLLGDAYMMKGLIFLSDSAALGVRIFIGLFLIHRLLAAEKPGRKIMVSAWSGAVMLLLVQYGLGLSEFYRTAMETVWIYVCASRFQNADRRMSLFISIFYRIGVSFWQFLAAAWLGVLFRAAEFPDAGTGYGLAGVWVLHGSLIVSVYFISRRQPIDAKGAFRFACGAALAGFFAVITLSEQRVLPIADDTLDMWTILSVILLMSVLVFNMNRQYEVEKELARLKAEQAGLLERDYTVLNRAYAVNAKLFHDFHNHIGVLRQLLSHNKVEEARHYLDELQAPVQEMAHTVWTGDDTVDYLINSKAAAAREREIQLHIQVEFPRHTNLQSADLCAILGNLLDNALEAAQKVQKPDQRMIQLTIRRIHQMLVIKVENSFAAAPVQEDGTLKTTKEENGLHGWGLKSARTAAEKYDGMLQTAYTDSIFRTVVTLSFQGVMVE